MRFEEITSNNYEAVRTIYQAGLDTGIASFETRSKTWEEWNHHYLPFARLALYEGGLIYGWAALSATSSRMVYAGVAEVSIYMDTDAQGRGYGTELLQQLISVSEEHGIWTLHASIFPQNKASVALHLKSGFREIGFRERIAQRDGIWYDNVLFERRSNVIHPA